ncbi:hypothetical protein GYA19_03760 [Candidatus Beckwithbacteria bacterium]|nr:hypothetical protein [Candidatus Beckwithbacteria bacterium]
MASLYDLELQESNNFIHALVDDGQLITLKLMEDQKKSFANMGEAGKTLLTQLEDPNSEMGANYAKLKAIEADIKVFMGEVGLACADAKKAMDILTQNPQSLQELSEDDKKTVSDYWLKKKTIVSKLIAKGYSEQELFS